jgi:hypothetical protein
MTMNSRNDAEKEKVICKEILELDSSIRFVGIANDMGTVVASAYRKGLNPLLSPEESQQFAMESVLRMTTRIDLSSKLGKPIHSFTLYEKVKRATIFLGNKECNIAMVSFDIAPEDDDIILNKISTRITNYLSTNKK